MGLFDRFFKKNRPVDARTAETRSRSTSMAGREIRQTQAEQDTTRSRMEAELDAQRLGHTAATADPACPHTTLTPRWDSVADMGNIEKVTSYTCQGCNQSFTASEGRTLLATEADRLRRDLGTEP